MHPVTRVSSCNHPVGVGFSFTLVERQNIQFFSVLILEMLRSYLRIRCFYLEMKKYEVLGIVTAKL